MASSQSLSVPTLTTEIEIGRIVANPEDTIMVVGERGFRLRSSTALPDRGVISSQVSLELSCRAPAMPSGGSTSLSVGVVRLNDCDGSANNSSGPHYQRP